jgi:putative transposase
VGGAHLAEGRKKGTERGAWIVFCDESGSLLTGHITHTWAPVGQTPVLTVVRGRQTRLSMAALLCYRPAGNGVAGPARLIWRTRPGWYHDRQLIDLLDTAHQRLSAPMILIWDNLAGHHSGRMHQAIKERDWLQVENLPSYAPDLNPAEGLWSLLDATVLANLAALTLGELRQAARAGLRTIQHRPALLNGFLTHTGLQPQPGT